MIDALPSVVHRALELDDETSIDARRVHVQSGPSPLPGFLHVDHRPRRPHVELRNPPWRLQLPSHWARQLLADDVVSGLAPEFRDPSLTEWQRVLAPDAICVVTISATDDDVDVAVKNLRQRMFDAGFRDVHRDDSHIGRLGLDDGRVAIVGTAA